MNTILKVTERIPDYALPYLINNDDSGLDKADKRVIDAWYQSYVDKLEPGQSIVINPCQDEGGFYWKPAFGPACNCIDCDVLILG